MRAIELNFFNTLALACMLVISVLFMAALLRAVKGPRVTDRLVAVNMIGTMTIAIIAILAEVLGEGGLVDICLIYAMISFLAIVVLTKVYMGVYRQRIIRAKAQEKQKLQEEGKA